MHLIVSVLFESDFLSDSSKVVQCISGRAGESNPESRLPGTSLLRRAASMGMAFPTACGEASAQSRSSPTYPTPQLEIPRALQEIVPCPCVGR